MSILAIIKQIYLTFPFKDNTVRFRYIYKDSLLHLKQNDILHSSVFFFMLTTL